MFFVFGKRKAPVTKTDCSKIYWHGDVTSGPNRWFDKSSQFLCQSNGKLGFIGEHSMADGMPVVALCSRVKKLQYGLLKNEEDDRQDENDNEEAKMPCIQNIFEDVFKSMDNNTSETIEKLLDRGMIVKFEFYFDWFNLKSL